MLQDLPPNMKDTVARNLLGKREYILLSFDAADREPTVIFQGVNTQHIATAIAHLTVVREGEKECRKKSSTMLGNRAGQPKRINQIQKA